MAQNVTVSIDFEQSLVNQIHVADPEEVKDKYADQPMFIPSVAKSFNPNIIDQRVGERHVIVEKAIVQAKDRAKSLEQEQKRRGIYEPDHFHLWKGKKGTQLLEEPQAPEFVANFFNQQSVIDGQLGKLQSQIIAGLIQQFNKVVFITNPKNYDITQLFETDNVLYMPGVKPVQQLAVDQYAKTMIQTVLQVVRKSSATQAIQFENVKLQRLEFFIQKLIDSGNENLKPMLNKILNSENYAHEMNLEEYKSGPVTCKDLTLTYDEIKKENHQLQEKMKELQNTLDHKINFANKQRIDSLKEIQVLRDRLIMMGSEINEETLKKNRVALNIHCFNPFEGYDKEIVELINERMKNIKHEAEIQITANKLLADSYLHKINLYKQLQPEDYSLVDMTLLHIMKDIAILEPQPYPVWNALLKAFPKGHFAGLIFEYANQDKDAEESGTYNRLMEIVENGLLHVRTKQMDTIEQIKERLTFLEKQLAHARNDQILQRNQHTAEIAKINYIHKEKFNLYVEQERLNIKLTLDKEKADLVRSNQRKKEKLKRLRLINQTYEVRRMIQKWKLSTIIMRYVEQLQTGFLDKESFKIFILQDIKRIFHGPEILKMHNAIKQTHQLKNEIKLQKIELIDENYQLRATINHLLTERQVHQQRIDSLGCELDEHLLIVDKHQQSQQDVLEDIELCEYKLKHTLEQFQNALVKVDQLEEKYGLKRSGKVKKMSIQKVKLIQAQRLVEMFKHEMECLELRLYGKMQLEKKAILCGKRNETMNQGAQTQIKDVNFGLQLVFSKPIKFQVMILKQDQDIQTDINSNIYDYMVKATATYDRILQSGQPIKLQDNFEEDDDDQIQKLIDLENTDAMMFHRRKNFASKAITKGVEEVDRTMANRSGLIYRSKTQRPEINQFGQGQFGQGQTGQMDLLSPDSDRNEHSRRRKIELKSNRLSPHAYENDTGQTPLSNVPIELESKLESTNKKDRSFNSSPNSMPFIQDVLSPTNDMQILTQINQITQLNPQQLQQIFFNHDWSRQMQKEKSIKDLKAQADQKTAMDCFEMYVELLQVMKDLEPESFKNAIMIIKEKKFPEFELKPFSDIKKLYPDFVPDVYTRLWETRLEPKESLERKRNYDKYRLEWTNKLKDQKLLDIKSKRKPILTMKNRSQLNTFIKNRSPSPEIEKQYRNKSNYSSQRSQNEIMQPISIENQAQKNSVIVKTIESDVYKSKTIFKDQSHVEILLQSVETLPNCNESKPNSPAKMSDVVNQSSHKNTQRLQSAKVQNSPQNRNQNSNERNLIEVHKNAKSSMDTVFPTGQLHVKSYIPKVQSGSFKVQDISASTIRMRSLGQIKEVEQNLPSRNITAVQSISDIVVQGRQDSDRRLEPSNKPFAVSVSQLKSYYPYDQEKKVKLTRPVTSKGRQTTFIPFLDGQQRKQSEAGFANIKMVSQEQSQRPLTGTTTNITFNGKELASRLSVAAGGGFNPMMFTKSGKDSKPSDSSMTSLHLNARKFQSNQQTIRLKEFDGGFDKKTLKAKNHRFKKKHSETPYEYVNRLKYGARVEQVPLPSNKIRRARPGTANTRVLQEALSIPLTMAPSSRKDYEPYAELTRNLLSHEHLQSSLKIDTFVSTNRHQPFRDLTQSNELLGKTLELINIGNNTEKRSAPLFTNQMLTQQQRNRQSIGPNQALHIHQMRLQ